MWSPLLSKTNKVDFSPHSWTFQTTFWSALGTWNPLPALAVLKCRWCLWRHKIHLTLFWPHSLVWVLVFVLCCTAPCRAELGFASRPCRHAAFWCMCLKLSSVPGREQYNQGSALFKDCNVGSRNSPRLWYFSAQLSQRWSDPLLTFNTSALFFLNFKSGATWNWTVSPDCVMVSGKHMSDREGSDTFKRWR